MSRGAGVPADDRARSGANSGGGARSSSTLAAPVVTSRSAGQRSTSGSSAQSGESSARTRPRPSPIPRHSGTGSLSSTTDSGDLDVLHLDDIGLSARIRQFLMSPPALLTIMMMVLAVAVNRHRLALDLAGGRLLPLESLGQTWSSYLASWHPVGGGSAAPAPAALAVLGVLGLPVGSSSAAVSLLLLGALPLAALSAYWATRAVPVSRKRRAFTAAGYALLPPAIAGLAQGRLDVLMTYLLLPVVLAGAASVLCGATDKRSGGWASTTAATALGVAVIGAFAPLVHLMLIMVMLIGFVVLPALRMTTLRRTLGLFAVVLLPLGLLMPWPAVVIQRPTVLVHGVGGVVPEQLPSWPRLLVLDPGGAGTLPWVGAVVVIAALIALAIRPSRTMLPGLGLVMLGAAAVALLGRLPMRPLVGGDPRPGFTGAALLFAGCGLLCIVLRAAGTAEPTWWTEAWRRKVFSATPWVGLMVLSAAAVVAGAGGPLAAGSSSGVPVLAPSLAAELARTETSVLVVGPPGEPVRLTRSRTARFGDDDIAPLRATGARLDRLAAALRAGQPGETPAAIADVAAIGVQFVVLPTAAQGEQALAAAGALARPAPPTTDGRPVLRVVRPVPGAELLGPALAAQARTGAAPPITPGVSGVLAPARPPQVAVRVASGADGRLLVVAANDEPGWQASVDGRAVPVVRGWGHQVAIPVGGNSAEVRVVRSDVSRTALLLIQAVLLLLVVGTALPSRRRQTR
jgi:hypothetical protein